MEVPQEYRGMKLVKCYKNFVLYEDKIHRECFSYYELGQRTPQIKVQNVEVNYYF